MPRHISITQKLKKQYRCKSSKNINVQPVDIFGMMQLKPECFPTCPMIGYARFAELLKEEFMEL